MRTCERWQIPNSTRSDQPFFQLYPMRVNKPLKLAPATQRSPLHDAGNRETAISAVDVSGHE